MIETVERVEVAEDQALLFSLERQFERKRIFRGVALFVAVATASYAALQSFQYVWLLITNCC